MNDKEKEFKEFLGKVVKASYEKIVDSHVFLQLLSHEGASQAPEILLQMGIAVLHDKPICLVVAEGVEVSNHLKKIAYTIEYFTPSIEPSISNAVKRALDKAPK